MTIMYRHGITIVNNNKISQYRYFQNIAIYHQNDNISQPYLIYDTVDMDSPVIIMLQKSKEV